MDISMTDGSCDSGNSSHEIQHAYDVIAVMLRQEATSYKRVMYDQSPLREKLREESVDGSWRQRIVEWMYGVVDHCNLHRDSVAVAAYFLDLSAVRGLVSTRRDFQLAAMTSLMMSIKLYESTSVKLESMVKLGRGLFTTDDVVAMESKILNAMNWLVHPPTPICFMRQFLRLLPSKSSVARYMVVEVSRFISEITTCLYKFIEYPSSVMAYASMLIAMERIDALTLSVHEREHFMRSVRECTGLESMSEIVLRAVRDLRKSLEHNVNLEDLLQTIDAHCQSEQLLQSQSMVATSKGARGTDSPRDVADVI